MGYQSLSQKECDPDGAHDCDSLSKCECPAGDLSPSKQEHGHSPSLPFARPSSSLGLFLDDGRDRDTDTDDDPNTRGRSDFLHHFVQGRSKKTNPRYSTLERGDWLPTEPDLQPSRIPFTEENLQQHRLPKIREQTSEPLHKSPRAQRPNPPATVVKRSSTESPTAEGRRQGDTFLRAVSGQSIPLRHPTPDLQALQGAYTGNIEHLERTAERLSMTSSIDDAIRDLHNDQKRLDSRRSSLLESQAIAIGQISRQVSNASSIVEVNSAARSGGFSPAGFIMSPK